MSARAIHPARTAIIGLGQTGLAVVRHLRALGEEVSVHDTRAHPPGLDALRTEFPEVACHLGRLEVSSLSAAQRIVLSPGVDPRQPAVRAARGHGTLVEGELPLFSRAANAPVVGITGSNGKSTVTRLLGEMAAEAGLDVAVGGNLGTPALDLLRVPAPDAYILELSSFQLETADDAWQPRAAALLNITPDHLDRYDSAADYAAAKARILTGARTVVRTADDPILRGYPHTASDVREFTVTGGADAAYRRVVRDGRAVLEVDGRPRMNTEDMPLKGAANHANALAACALADALGCSEAAQQRALRRFQGLPHRMEPVAERNGVLWINDSKATNAGAAIAALRGLDRPAILIAGGDGKGADFALLGEAAADCARAVLTVGRDGEAVGKAVRAATRHTPVEACGSVAAAVERAAARAVAGDIVLLAPACASFDQFEGFEARGRAFRDAVREVTGG